MAAAGGRPDGDMSGMQRNRPVSQMAGAMRFNLTCPKCGGSGKLRNACPTCHGEGRIAHTETVDVRIPPGARNGSRLRVPGKGNAGTMGAPPGDFTSTRAWRSIPIFTGRATTLKSACR